MSRHDEVMSNYNDILDFIERETIAQFNKKHYFHRNIEFSLKETIKTLLLHTPSEVNSSNFIFEPEA